MSAMQEVLRDTGIFVFWLILIPVLVCTIDIVKNGAIDYICFAMSFPDRLIELYGYQIISDTSNPDNFAT